VTGSRGIREGMVVHSADGERLGKVRKCDADGFYVEKGFFFPEEHFARYSDVREVRGDDVRLSLAKDQLATPPPAPGAMALRDAADATAAAANAPRADDEGWTPRGDQGFVRDQPEYGAAYHAGSGADERYERHASADIPAAPYEPELDSDREYWRESRREDEQRPVERGARRDDDEQPRSGVGAPGAGPGSDFVI
jgi:hypothetical protein